MLLTGEPQHHARIAGGTATRLSLSPSLLLHLLWLCAVLAPPVGAAFLAQESPDVLPYKAREKQAYLFLSWRKKRLSYVPEIPLRRKMWHSGQRPFAEVCRMVWSGNVFAALLHFSISSTQSGPSGSCKANLETGRRISLSGILEVFSFWARACKGSELAVMLIPKGM